MHNISEVSYLSDTDVHTEHDTTEGCILFLKDAFYFQI